MFIDTKSPNRDQHFISFLTNIINATRNTFQQQNCYNIKWF